jgi:hypothetical protein
VDDRRLAGSGTTECGQEAPSVVHPLDVGTDDLRLWVVCQVVQEVRLVQVHGVAVVHGLAEAQASGGAVADHLDGVVPALRDEGHRPGVFR